MLSQIMHCNLQVKTLVCVQGLQTSLLFLQLLLCTKNKFLATSTLMSLLTNAGLSLSIFWQGTFTSLPREVDLFCVPRHSELYPAFVLLNLSSWKSSAYCYDINCSFPVTCILGGFIPGKEGWTHLCACDCALKIIGCFTFLPQQL